MLFWPVKLAFRLVSLLVFAIIVYVVVSGVQVDLASNIPAGTTGLNAAQAIVVLPGTLTAGAPSPDLLGRLQEALACYQDHLAPRLVVTGGAATATEPSASTVARNWLAQNGVPASALSEETASDATSAMGGLTALTGPSPNVILVTDAVATYWTRAVAKEKGITAQIAPASGSTVAFYREFGSLWNQASAVAVGRIIGFGRATWAGH